MDLVKNQEYGYSCIITATQRELYSDRIEITSAGDYHKSCQRQIFLKVLQHREIKN